MAGVAIAVGVGVVAAFAEEGLERLADIGLGHLVGEVRGGTSVVGKGPVLIETSPSTSAP